MAAVLTAALLVPLGGPPPFGFAGDFIVLLYFLSLVSVAIMLGAMAGGASYTISGGLREVMTLLLRRHRRRRRLLDGDGQYALASNRGLARVAGRRWAQLLDAPGDALRFS